MIRVCIQCKHVFGCHGNDGMKWKCSNCRKYASCDTRTVLDPPDQDVTGGICDWCFDHLVIPGRSKIPPRTA